MDLQPEASLGCATASHRRCVSASLVLTGVPACYQTCLQTAGMQSFWVLLTGLHLFGDELTGNGHVHLHGYQSFLCSLIFGNFFEQPVKALLACTLRHLWLWLTPVDTHGIPTGYPTHRGKLGPLRVVDTYGIHIRYPTSAPPSTCAHLVDTHGIHIRYPTDSIKPWLPPGVSTFNYHGFLRSQIVA